jgi:hypothetical protein
LEFRDCGSVEAPAGDGQCRLFFGADGLLENQAIRRITS